MMWLARKAREEPRAALPEARRGEWRMINYDLRGFDVTRMLQRSIAKYEERANWRLVARGSHFEDAQAVDANLAGADFSRADMINANFTRANLAGADLAGANLTGANLTGADLTEADLTDADLTDAVLEATRVDKADFRLAKVSLQQLLEGCWWDKRDPENAPLLPDGVSPDQLGGVSA